MPGMSAAQFNVDSEILWGGDDHRIEVLRMDAVVDSASVDSGSTPTNVLRKGMLFGRVASSSKYMPWDPSQTDGREQLFGVNPVELRMVDMFGTASDRFAPVVVKAPLQAAKLLILGSALVGNTNEYLARRGLYLLGCKLDDDPQGFLSGLVPRVAIKTGNYTVLQADNGTSFQATTANVNFTLPTIKPGLSFEFTRVDGFNLVLTGSANLFVGNNASATSVTFSTAGNLIGAALRVDGMYVNGVLKWVVKMSPAPFSTGLFETIAIA